MLLISNTSCRSMRIALVIGLLLIVSFCNAEHTSGYADAILKLWSNTTNRSETLAMMAQEAKRIGLRKVEYYRVCTGVSIALLVLRYYAGN